MAEISTKAVAGAGVGALVAIALAFVGNADASSVEAADPPRVADLPAGASVLRGVGNQASGGQRAEPARGQSR